MKIGYAQDVITPSLDKPVFLAGFGNNRRADWLRSYFPRWSKKAWMMRWRNQNDPEELIRKYGA